MQASMTTDDDYTNMEIGDLMDDQGVSQSSSMDTLSEVNVSPKSNKLRRGSSPDAASIQSINDALEMGGSESLPSVIPVVNNYLRDGDIGSLLGDDPPLLYCTRVLCSKFLLSGHRHGVISDGEVRVSVKALSLGCVGFIVMLQPTVLLENLHKSSPLSGQSCVSLCHHI
jgi:huntingtin